MQCRGLDVVCKDRDDEDKKAAGTDVWLFELCSWKCVIRNTKRGLSLRGQARESHKPPLLQVRVRRYVPVGMQLSRKAKVMAAEGIWRPVTMSFGDFCTEYEDPDRTSHYPRGGTGSLRAYSGRRPGIGGVSREIVPCQYGDHHY